MTRDGHQIGRFPVEMITRIDEAIAETGSTESRIQWVLAACEQRLQSDEAEAVEPEERSIGDAILADRAAAFSRGRRAG